MKTLATIVAYSFIATQMSFLSASSAMAQGKFLKRPKAAKPECFCTDRMGKRKELGDIICLTVGGRSYEAKCIMAQNNPFWRDLNRGCMSS